MGTIDTATLSDQGIVMIPKRYAALFPARKLYATTVHVPEENHILCLSSLPTYDTPYTFSCREITLTGKGHGRVSLGDLCLAIEIRSTQKLHCIIYQKDRLPHLSWPGIDSVLELWSPECLIHHKQRALLEYPQLTGPRSLWSKPD